MITPDKDDPVVSNECVALLDAVLDLATEGKVQSVAIVMVTAPGVYRISAAGSDVEGLLAGTRNMDAQLSRLMPAPATKPALTVLHNTLRK